MFETRSKRAMYWVALLTFFYNFSWPLPIEKEKFKGNYNTLSISLHMETKG